MDNINFDAVIEIALGVYFGILGVAFTALILFALFVGYVVDRRGRLTR